MREQFAFGVLVLLAMLTNQAAWADVVLRNGTGYNIPYQCKFGDCGWVNYLLPTGGKQSWNGSGPSQIRFQSDIDNGGGLKEYTLPDASGRFCVYTFRVTVLGIVDLHNCP